MTDEKPLTKADLISALKGLRQEINGDMAALRQEIKGDMIALRQQVREDAFEDRTEFYSKMIKPEIDGLRAEMKAGFKNVDDRFEKLETELSWLKNDFKGLKEALATTPDRKEFNRLKAKVDKYHPAN